MKLKLDENLPLSAKKLCADHGHDVDTVLDEGLTGASDTAVVAAATADGRLLLTLDRGLGDVRAYPPGSHPGILVLRLPDQSSAAARAAIEALLTNHDLDPLAGAVTVVQRGLLRIRRP